MVERKEGRDELVGSRNQKREKGGGDKESKSKATDAPRDKTVAEKA